MPDSILRTSARTAPYVLDAAQRKRPWNRNGFSLLPGRHDPPHQDLSDHPDAPWTRSAGRRRWIWKAIADPPRFVHCRIQVLSDYAHQVS